MNILTPRPALPDNGRVPAKSGTGFGDLNTQSALTAQRGFFMCAHLVRSSMSGDSGEAFGLAGGFECRFANPTICRSPRLATGSGVTTTQRGTIMPSTNTPDQFPITADLAHAIGADCAQEWFHLSFKGRMPSRLPGWRSFYRADFIMRRTTDANVSDLLDAWERGFDAMVHDAALAEDARRFPAPANDDAAIDIAIERQAENAAFLAVVLMSVNDIPSLKKAHLGWCARLAADLARDVAALVGCAT